MKQMRCRLWGGSGGVASVPSGGLIGVWWERENRQDGRALRSTTYYYYCLWLAIVTVLLIWRRKYAAEKPVERILVPGNTGRRRTGDL